MSSRSRWRESGGTVRNGGPPHLIHVALIPLVRALAPAGVAPAALVNRGYPVSVLGACTRAFCGRPVGSSGAFCDRR